MNYGNKVTVIWSDNTKSVFRNVTELHWNYGNFGRLAIESDIHSTGFTPEIARIREVETDLEEKKEPSFDEVLTKYPKLKIIDSEVELPLDVLKKNLECLKREMATFDTDTNYTNYLKGEFRAYEHAISLLEQEHN